MKEAATAGLTPLDYQERMKGQEAVGTAIGGRVAEAITAGGKPARDTLNDLNSIQDAVRQGGDNIKYGPGAEYWNKAKQVLNNIYPQQGLAEADTIEKMNARLAAAAAKSHDRAAVTTGIQARSCRTTRAS